MSQRNNFYTCINLSDEDDTIADDNIIDSKTVDDKLITKENCYIKNIPEMLSVKNTDNSLEHFKTKSMKMGKNFHNIIQEKNNNIDIICDKVLDHDKIKSFSSLFNFSLPLLDDTNDDNVIQPQGSIFKGVKAAEVFNSKRDKLHIRDNKFDFIEENKIDLNSKSSDISLLGEDKKICLALNNTRTIDLVEIEDESTDNVIPSIVDCFKVNENLLLTMPTNIYANSLNQEKHLFGNKNSPSADYKFIASTPKINRINISKNLIRTDIVGISCDIPSPKDALKTTQNMDKINDDIFKEKEVIHSRFSETLPKNGKILAEDSDIAIIDLQMDGSHLLYDHNKLYAPKYNNGVGEIRANADPNLIKPFGDKFCLPDLSTESIKLGKIFNYDQSLQRDNLTETIDKTNNKYMIENDLNLNLDPTPFNNNSVIILGDCYQRPTYRDLGTNTNTSSPITKRRNFIETTPTKNVTLKKSPSEIMDLKSHPGGNLSKKSSNFLSPIEKTALPFTHCTKITTPKKRIHKNTDSSIKDKNSKVNSKIKSPQRIGRKEYHVKCLGLSTPQLIKEASKYGVKKFSRNKLCTILTYIYCHMDGEPTFERIEGVFPREDEVSGRNAAYGKSKRKGGKRIISEERKTSKESRKRARKSLNLYQNTEAAVPEIDVMRGENLSRENSHEVPNLSDVSGIFMSPMKHLERETEMDINHCERAAIGSEIISNSIDNSWTNERSVIEEPDELLSLMQRIKGKTLNIDNTDLGTNVPQMDSKLSGESETNAHIENDELNFSTQKGAKLKTRRIDVTDQVIRDYIKYDPIVHSQILSYQPILFDTLLNGLNNQYLPSLTRIEVSPLALSHDNCQSIQTNKNSVINNLKKCEDPIIGQSDSNREFSYIEIDTTLPLSSDDVKPPCPNITDKIDNIIYSYKKCPKKRLVKFLDLHCITFQFNPLNADWNHKVRKRKKR
ncbi:uncharacterized protein LOC135929684 [Gordionus sp. m RMFG-2023]|uniref:uncharacterized protein LOC135929684 n=1 Tax=Gordionus sp. m RMFG-2023 TaxID=3053472 RepID=UPI0031FBF027